MRHSVLSNSLVPQILERVGPRQLTEETGADYPGDQRDGMEGEGMGRGAEGMGRGGPYDTGNLKS